MQFQRPLEAPLLRAMPWGKRFCPVCERGYPWWIDWGWPTPVNQAYHVIGARKRRHLCPGCGSTDRHRLCLTWLRQNTTGLLVEGSRVLHVAPEPMLRDYFAALDGVDYVAGDKRASLHDYPESVMDLDLCALSFADHQFDLVVCNHVLEHIVDDTRAMSEILRVMKVGGYALLQVPYTLDVAHSIESREIAERGDPEELEAHFGQYDHVRIYTRNDYVARLRSVGFEVMPLPGKALIDDPGYKHSFDAEEELFVCRRARSRMNR